MLDRHTHRQSIHTHTNIIIFLNTYVACVLISSLTPVVFVYSFILFSQVILPQVCVFIIKREALRIFLRCLFPHSFLPFTPHFHLYFSCSCDVTRHHWFTYFPSPLPSDRCILKKAFLYTLLSSRCRYLRYHFFFLLHSESHNFAYAFQG